MPSASKSNYSLVFPPAIAEAAPVTTDGAVGSSVQLTFASQAVLLFMWSSVLAGPLRYVSILAHLPLYLLPKALLLVPIGWRFVRFRADLRQWLIAAALCVLVLVALDHHIRPFQAVFGLWTLLPLVFAMLFPQAVIDAVSPKVCASILGVSLFGELASALVVFPWSGLDARLVVLQPGPLASGDVGWGAPPGRLCGFIDRSVADIVIFGVILASKQVRPALRLGLLVVTTAAIYGTTMKTAVAAFVLIAIPIVLPIRPVRIAAAVGGLIAMGLVLRFLLRCSRDRSRWIGS